MTPERIGQAGHFGRELSRGDIFGRILAVPTLIASLNLLDRQISFQEEALEAWRQANRTTQTIDRVLYQANENNENKEKDWALVILNTESIDEMQGTIDTIEEKGGDVVHVFPLQGLIASLHPDCEQALSEEASIASIHRGPVDPSAYNQETQWAVEAWNANFIPSQEPQTSPLSVEEAGTEMMADAFPAPDVPAEGKEVAAQETSLNYYKTSEYLIGKVSVGIIFPESNGIINPSTEDWTKEEQVKVISEIVTATNWLADREPRAHLEFYYDIKTVPTGYEPIKNSHLDLNLSINEVMSNLGFDSSSPIPQVRDYDNALRDHYYTDWAFTLFVVDSSNDIDHSFADGYFAWAFLQGPYMVVTNHNFGFGPDNLDAVVAHEMAHIFGALDQYPEAKIPCTGYGGYLLVENQNSQYGVCFLNVPSIVRANPVQPFAKGALDIYARGQVGWWDLNGNNILDPVDPEARGAYLYPYRPPDLASTGERVYRGLAIATANVASVEYQVGNSGIWLPVNPLHGALNGFAEPFQFIAPETSIRNQLFFQIRVTDSNGIPRVDTYSWEELIDLRPRIWLPGVTNRF